MFSVFSYAFNAISPILFLVILGYLLKTKNIFEEKFFDNLNRFAFHYCFPFLMFTNLYSLGSIREINYRLVGYMLASAVVLTVMGFIVADRITNVRNRKGVIIQAGFRGNFAIIGLPLAEGLAGSEGLTTASSMQAPVVIYYNFFSILILTIFSDSAEFDIRKVARNIVRNPLIRGLALGLAALILRNFIPLDSDGNLVFSIKGSLPWLYTIISYLSRISTPLALIALGGRFNFSQVSGLKKELFTSVFMRLILAPVIGFTMAFTAAHFGFISLTPPVVATLIACYGSPLAVSAAPMAAEMGGDGKLAGQIVVWSSLFSMITIFILTIIFRTAGLL